MRIMGWGEDLWVFYMLKDKDIYEGQRVWQDLE